MVWRIFIVEPTGVMHVNVIARGSFFAITNDGIDFFEFRHDVFLDVFLLGEMTG
jgi:hypothetical protein